MADLHIEEFCHDTLRTLIQLYQVFPRRRAIYVEDICGSDEPDELGMHSARHLACLGTMLWLAEEGYIRYVDTIYQEGIDQAVLTHRSFVLLTGVSNLRLREPEPDSPPGVAHEKLMLSEQMRAALQSRSSERITAVARYFLSHEPQPVQADEYHGIITPERPGEPDPEGAEDPPEPDYPPGWPEQGKPPHS